LPLIYLSWSQIRRHFPELYVRLPSGVGPKRYKNQGTTVTVNNPHINKLIQQRR